MEDGPCGIDLDVNPSVIMPVIETKMSADIPAYTVKGSGKNQKCPRCHLRPTDRRDNVHVQTGSSARHHRAGCNLPEPFPTVFHSGRVPTVQGVFFSWNYVGVFGVHCSFRRR